MLITDRGRRVMVKLYPRPKGGVWDWRRCYFRPGDEVNVLALDFEEYKGTVTAVKRNVYGRISYIVTRGLGRKRKVKAESHLDLEDLTGWHALPIEYRSRRTMQQLGAWKAGRRDTRLIFPVGRSRSR